MKACPYHIAKLADRARVDAVEVVANRTCGENEIRRVRGVPPHRDRCLDGGRRHVGEIRSQKQPTNPLHVTEGVHALLSR